MRFLVKIFSLGLVFSIYSLPIKERLIQGDVQFLKENGLLSIVQESKDAIIEWEEFCLEKHEKIQFQFLEENASILNRVVGDKSSKINGEIQSNGNVFLINEQGVLIGSSGAVKSEGFVCSTLDLKNEDFLEKRLVFQGNKNTELKNKGFIQSERKNIYLVSNQVDNLGKIHVKEGDVKIVSGSKINCLGHQIAILESKETDIINQGGIIEAVQIEEKGGHLFLLGEKATIHLHGKHVARKKEKGGEITASAKEVNLYKDAVLDCSGKIGGGSIFVGGGFQGKDSTINNARSVWVSKQAKLKADAQRIGDGGQVIIWSDKQTLFGGEILARGGNESGDGGFVEVSSPGTWIFQGIVDTKALNGKMGTLLLDPSDIIIDNFGGSSTPAFPTTPPGTYNPTGATGSLDVSDVQNTLVLNNVTVLTSGGTGGSGSITINQGFNWATPTTFTAIADRNIVIDGVTLSSTGVGSFTAFNLQANQGVATSGNFHGVEITNATINTVQGNINISSKSGTSSQNNGIVLESSTIQSSATGTITLNGVVNLTASGEGHKGLNIERGSIITSQSGNIDLTGFSNGSGTYNAGILISDSSIESTGLSLGAATITLNGTGGSGTHECNGLQIENGSIITSIDGNIDITSISNGTDTYNAGMQIVSESMISSTGTGVSAATITIHSTSGTGSTENHGMVMDIANITSVDGDIQMTPISRGTDDYNYGLLMKESSISSTGMIAGADITINATGGAGEDEVYGVRGDSLSSITAETGTVTITGGVFFDPS